MADNYVVKNEELVATADKIRAKSGGTEGVVWNENTGFADAVEALPERLPDVEQATPAISVSSTGLITASAEQAEGSVGAGTKSSTKQLTTQAAKTVTPSASDQTAVASGRYTTGAVTVKGDANLKAANIAKGISIFGVTGTLASGAKIASGTFSPSGFRLDNNPVTVSGLGFKPSFVFFYLDVETYENDTYVLKGDNTWESTHQLVCAFDDGTTRRAFANYYTWVEDEDTGEETLETGVVVVGNITITMNDDGFTISASYGQPGVSRSSTYKYYAFA